MRTTMLLALVATLLGPAVTAASAQPKPKRSWPMFGGTPGRNMVNPPLDFADVIVSRTVCC